ncbi:YMGG-like glycine zipper-containing protein [Acidobacteriota bacterium]
MSEIKSDFPGQITSLFQELTDILYEHRTTAIGGGIGAAIGCVMGGPIGAGIGGCIGGVIGNLRETKSPKKEDDK